MASDKIASFWSSILRKNLVWEFGGRAIGFEEGLMNESLRTQTESKKIFTFVKSECEELMSILGAKQKWYYHYSGVSLSLLQWVHESIPWLVQFIRETIVSLKIETRARNNGNWISFIFVWWRTTIKVGEGLVVWELFLSVGSCASEKHWITTCEGLGYEWHLGTIAHNEWFAGPLEAQGKCDFAIAC